MLWKRKSVCAGDLVGAGRKVGDGGADDGDRDRGDKLGEHCECLAVDRQAGIEARDEVFDLPDGNQGDHHAGRQRIQKVGLQVEGKALPSFPIR